MRLGKLPAGLEYPLHLLEPWPWGEILTVIFLAFLLALLVWRRRRRKAPEAPATPPPVPSPVVPTRGLADAVADLRRRYRMTGDTRGACHELAGLVRGHFERLRGRPYTVLTAGEIRRREGDSPLSRLFGRLATLQFGRESPSRQDFDGACDVVLEVTEKP